MIIFGASDMTGSFHSHGKLLLTGEYAVLDGALALAMPTRYGQSLRVAQKPEPILSWESMDDQGRAWFAADYDISRLRNTTETSFTLQDERHRSVAATLEHLLRTALELSPTFLTGPEGFKVFTQTDFPKNWGLGTSSTLVSNLAYWARVDPYLLQREVFGGSGYDIACARSQGPLTYRLAEGKPEVRQVDFDPTFADRLVFIYLNRKQDTREGIARFRSTGSDPARVSGEISKITKALLDCTDQQTFNGLLQEHERIISEQVGLTPIKQRLFPDFEGAIKSLGAWGGDFALASGDANTASYFHTRGFTTAIPYRKMALHLG